MGKTQHETETDDIVDEWIAFKDGIDTDTYAVGRFAFEAIARGEEPRLEDAARSLRREAADVREAADRLTGWGLVTLDEAGGRVTGAYGLTVEPTEYRLDLDGLRLHAWCALDAVGIPAALEADAVVEAPVRGSDDMIRLRIEGGRLVDDGGQDVRIALPDVRLEADVRRDVCPEIAFYRAADAPRHPRVAHLDLDEAIAVGHRMWGKRPEASN